MRGAWFAVVAMLLSGCFGGGGGEEVQEAREPPEGSALGGIVVDPALLPVADARVRVEGESVRTGADGRFAVDGLEPGRVVLEVWAQGFLLQHVGVDVAPEGTNDVVVVLQPDAVGSPYVQAWETRGFLGFSAYADLVVHRFAVTAGALGGEGSSMHARDVEQPPAWVQAEMVWTSSQPLADEMSLALSRDRSGVLAGERLAYEVGASPLVASVDGDGMASVDRLRLGATTATDDGPAASVAVEQSYVVYEHWFHNFRPEPGWTFGQDGPHPVPRE